MNPAAAGPLINAYRPITVKMFAFGAGPFFEYFYDLGLKKGGPCSESRVGPFSESDNTLCEWGKNWN